MWCVLCGSLALLPTQGESAGGADDQIGLIALVQITVTTEANQTGLAAQSVNCVQWSYLGAILYSDQAGFFFCKFCRNLDQLE